MAPFTVAPVGRGPVSADVLAPSTLVSELAPSPEVGRPLFVSSAGTLEPAPTMVTFAGRNTTVLFDPAVSIHTPVVSASEAATVYAKRSVRSPWSTLSISIRFRLLAGVASSPTCRRSRGVPVTETGSLYSTSTRILSPSTKVSFSPSLSAS